MSGSNPQDIILFYGNIRYQICFLMLANISVSVQQSDIFCTFLMPKNYVRDGVIASTKQRINQLFQ